MAYLLDANVFIQASRLHYGMDFCPAFWDWLMQQNQAERVFSIEAVGDELAAGDDLLSEWANNRGRDLFLPPDPQMLSALSTIGEWVHGQDYRQAAVSTFLQDADYYLIAYALAHEHVVVTHEKPDNGKKRVKIPNVCIGLNVKFLNTFQMLRNEKARFVLEKVG